MTSVDPEVLSPSTEACSRIERSFAVQALPGPGMSLPIQRASARGSSRERKSRGQRTEPARLDVSSGEMKGAKDVEFLQVELRLELASDEAGAALLSEGDEPPPRHTASAAAVNLKGAACICIVLSSPA